MQDQFNAITGMLAGRSDGMAQIGLLSFLFLMTVALAASLLASYLYLQFYATRTSGSDVHRAFPLLGVSITAIFVCIQFSLPLSLGLLGALSIVRFRTPIKEPEEIGFIMLVIATSIATATFKLAFVGVIFVVAIAALAIQTTVRRRRAGRSDGTIVITLRDATQPAGGSAVTSLLRQRLAHTELESIARHDGQVVYAYQFKGVTTDALLALQHDLDHSGAAASFSVFLSRPSAL